MKALFTTLVVALFLVSFTSAQNCTDPNCALCPYNPARCEICQPGWWAWQVGCVQACPANAFLQTNLSRCMCRPGYALLVSGCVQSDACPYVDNIAFGDGGDLELSNAVDTSYICGQYNNPTFYTFYGYKLATASICPPNSDGSLTNFRICTCNAGFVAYRYNFTCISSCPTGMVPDVMRNCRCQSGFEFYGQCVQYCPPGSAMYLDPPMCACNYFTSAASTLKWYYYNNSCYQALTGCPAGNSILDFTGGSDDYACIPYASAVVVAGTTIVSCQAQTYSTGTACAACSANCWSCTSPIVCTICTYGFYLSSSSSCAACPTNCAVCNSTSCIYCKNGYVLQGSTCSAYCSTGYAHGGVCLPSCPSPYFPTIYNTVNLYPANHPYFASNLSTANFTACQMCSVGCTTCTSTTACTACATGFVLQNGACTACPSNCTTCTSATQCTICTTGYIISTNGLCVLACPSGSFLNTSANATLNPSGICQSCGPYCALCVNASNCTNCTLSATLLPNATCQAPSTGCPANCYSCINNICYSCKPGYYVSQNVTSNTISCNACPSGCEFCGASMCYRCFPGLSLQNSTNGTIACLGNTTPGSSAGVALGCVGTAFGAGSLAFVLVKNAAVETATAAA